MTRENCESGLRSALQSLGIYTTLIAVILVTCIMTLECFVVIYHIQDVPHVYQEQYIIMAIINIICVGVLFYKGVPEIKKLKNGNETALSEVTILFIITLYLGIIFSNVGNFSKPDFLIEGNRPDWYLMFLLLNAPVIEEILFRVLCIGIPVLLIALITGKECHSLWKYPTGGFKINKLALFFIFFSSFIFGAAHIKDWGVWKFYMASIQGIMLGYLFVKYGFYASVSIHFLIDCLPMEIRLFGDDLFGGLPVAIIIIIGIPCVYLYVKKRKQCFSETLLKGKVTGCIDNNIG